MEELQEESLERAQGDISEADSNNACVESLKSSMEHSNSSDVPEKNMNDADNCANDDTAGDTEVEASKEMDAKCVVLADEYNEDETIASEQSPACSERSPGDDSVNEFDTESTNVDKSTLDTENARPEESIVNNGNANDDEPTSPINGDGEQELLNGDNRSDAIEPVERTEESPAGGDAADSVRLNSSDEGDFLGFDSATIETSLGKTSEFIQSLQSKETVLARANEPEDTDVASTSSAIPETSVNAVPNMIDNADLSNHLGPQFDQSQPDTMTAQAQMKNSRKPNSVQTVYGLPVNIFDETLPSGSKRVKKKRKFFDDFDESENEKASRKSSLSRPNEEGVKLLNASGENKENFISDEKMKTESVPENDTAGQNKAKRAYSFDISNPLFKEPFKHGWKREICYRHLPEGSKSKPAYVSYYSPEGKKLKTIRQIVDGLPTDSELGTQHFTFSVQRIFNEPSEFEILKDAKPRTDLNDSDTVNNDSMDTTPTAHLAAHITPPDPGKFVSRKKLPTSGTRLVIKKPKYLKQADSEDDGSDTTLLLQSAPSSVTPKIVIKGASLNSTKTNAAKPKSTSILKKDRKSVGKKQEKSSKKSSLSAERIHGSMREYANSSDASTPSISKKRKLSDDASGVPAAKVAKLDGERMVHAYRSALTLSNVAQLYNPLTACFKYLTVRDLLRVSMSCKYLNRIASERNLWTTVRLKNSKVRDWNGFARTLRKYATKKLDLRKMLCPSTPDDVNAMWNAFLEKITTVTSLEHIEFSRCNAQVVETVARTCPNLVVINAVQLRNGDGLSIESFAKLENLRELRLKGLNGLKIETGVEELHFQSREIMRVLSLTSIKNLNLATVRAIGALSHVHSLELGECNGALVDELAVSISKLSNLRRLRLEQITNLDPHFKLFESLRSLPQLKSLELINIEVKMGFCEAIASCTNIENLVIFPLYKTESATSNRLIMDSLLSLSESLKSFVWGLTHELIRATDFYANKFIEKPSNGSEESNVSPKKGPDSIPIVKRISKQPEVDILSVRNLEKMLAAALPQSHVKVITVANALAWRQN